MTPDAPFTENRVDCANHQDAMFCDGFEDPDLSAWDLYGGVMRVVRPTPRGTAVLQADTTGPGQISEAGVNFGPFVSGTLAARAWLYIPSGFPVIHFDLIDLKYAQNGGIGVLGYYGDLVIYQNLTGETTTVGVTVPRDRWMCVELRLEVSNPGRATLFLDDVSIAEVSGIDAAPAQGYNRVNVGLPWTDETQGNTRVFVDELVLDNKPIGCN